MVTRVLKVVKKQIDPNNMLYEETPDQEQYTDSPIGKQIKDNIPIEDKIKSIGWALAQCIIGVAISYFGIFNAGSLFSTGTMYQGMLATIFYVWQVAWILETVGIILIYDGLKKCIPNLIYVVTYTIEEFKNRNDKGYN